MPGTVLAVDFGSSNTAAAYRDTEGRIHELRLSSTSTLMPSAVLWTPSRVVVGPAAVQAMLSDPDAFEPSPKRRLADREIFLGVALVAVSDLVAAVLAEVFARAVRVMGGPPDQVVLTHPDKWSAGQRAQLAEAAAAAGVAPDRLTLVSEATAAAQFYTATGAGLPAGARVAVCDFGAGTVDVAVLDKRPDGGFAVVAADGVEGLGGHDLDARINGWVRRQLYADDPVLAAELDGHTDVGDRLVLTDRIRAAKEALSEITTASIAVRGVAGTRTVQLTRDEFNALIAPDVERAVELTRRVLADANAIRPSTGAPTIYLAGGTSAIPLIHDRLAELGTIATLGDPKTVVCQGALHAAPPAEGSSPRIASAQEPPGAPKPSVVQQDPQAPPKPDVVPRPTAAPTAPVIPPQPASVQPSPPLRHRRAVILAVTAAAVIIGVVAVIAITARINDSPTIATNATHTDDTGQAGTSDRRQTVLPLTGLGSPVGLAVNGAGELYVVDEENDRVVMLAAGSREQTLLPFTGLKNPIGVAVDAAGAVYVTDADDNRVLMLAPGSREQAVLPFSDLNRPSGVAVDDAGAVYVSDTSDDRVVVLAAGSREQTLLPVNGVESSFGMTVDAASAVYVTDYFNGRVVVLAAGSREQTVLPFTGLIRPYAVAVDAAGVVYVTDYQSNRVVALAAGSQEQTVLPFQGLSNPSGVAVDATGAVYVADTGNDRILKLAPE